MNVVLCGRTSKLREVRQTDVEYYYKWRNDPQIFKYLGGGYQESTFEEVEQLVSKFIVDNNNFRMTILSETNLPIGMIGLYNLNLKNKNGEIGMYIGDKNYHGKGYASDAYIIFESFVKQKYQLIKLKLYVVSENIAAVKLWISLGYKQVGLLSNERFIDGKWHNVIIMEKMI